MTRFEARESFVLPASQEAATRCLMNSQNDDDKS